MIFKLQLVFLKRSLENVILDWSAKITPSCNSLLLPLCYQATPKPVGRIAKACFARAKFIRQIFCSFPSAPMCRKSRKHALNTEVTLTRVEATAIFLSDRNDLLRECAFDIICQIWPIRGYTRSWYTGTGRLKKWWGSAAPALPSFLPFYFHLHAFLIQRAPLSWSLEQARSLGTVYPIIIYGDILLPHS